MSNQDVGAVKLKPVVVNPKVEQVVRAIYFGFDSSSTSVMHSQVRKGTIMRQYSPDAHVVIGIADAKGYRLNPASNSMLAAMGYHPTAVLLWLTQLRLNGQPVVKVQGEDLVAVHGAVVQCARDVVFNYHKLEMIKRKPVVVARPILEFYRKYGKPKKFA